LNVLALDTSTECCSAALLRADGSVLLRQQVTDRGHAELILPMIDELLREAGLELAQLAGLAFGRGPGGFTGVRVAAGVAQGLAYGAGLEVVPVSSLAAVAWHAATDDGVLVCNDARMGEVYWACYRCATPDRDTPVLLSAERVGPPATVEAAPGVTVFAGNGLAPHPALHQRLERGGLQFRDGLYPTAVAVARIGAAALRRGEGLDAAQALPTYVRDDVARPPAGTVIGMS
jgi:tRNA threonylcarbamoyladenosine biosynthesis protein TsaB